jgi:hypothetical protein
MGLSFAASRTVVEKFYCVSIIVQTFKSSDKGGIKGSWYINLFYSGWVGLVQPDTPLFVTAGPLTFARGAVREVIRLDIFRDSCFESMRLWTRQSQGSTLWCFAFRWTFGLRRQCLKVCRALLYVRVTTSGGVVGWGESFSTARPWGSARTQIACASFVEW